MKTSNFFVRLQYAAIRALNFVFPPWNIGWKTGVLILGGGGTVIVLVVMLVTVWMVPGPKLSGDTVAQIGKARAVCSSEADVPETSDCSIEAWKACHVAQEYLQENSDVEYVEGAMYICDLAVIADAGELALALNNRYGTNFRPVGNQAGSGVRYKTTYEIPFDVAENDNLGSNNQQYIVPYRNFAMFNDLVWLQSLVLAPTTGSPDILDSQINVYADSTFPLALSKNRNKYPFYSNFTTATKDLLWELKNSIFNIFYEIEKFHQVRESSIEPKVGNNPWLNSFDQILPDSVKLICDDARIAIRLNTPDAEESFGYCKQAAKICEDVTPNSTQACSHAAGSVELEYRWQRLPEKCSKVYDATELGIDECRLAAHELCQYQQVSSQDYWIGQLISMNNFACATAGYAMN